MACSYLEKSLCILALCAAFPGCAEKNYPDHHASFKLVDKTVGCASTDSNAKKEDQFESRYKNHWLTWRGKVQVAGTDSLSIDMDGHGIQDLFVRMKIAKAGYDVRKGDIVTVRFLMKDIGGCIMPFSGEEAIFIEGIPKSQLFTQDDDYYSR